MLNRVMMLLELLSGSEEGWDSSFCWWVPACLDITGSRFIEGHRECWPEPNRQIYGQV
jgi:hypothetical protein